MNNSSLFTHLRRKPRLYGRWAPRQHQRFLARFAVRLRDGRENKMHENRSSKRLRAKRWIQLAGPEPLQRSYFPVPSLCLHHVRHSSDKARLAQFETTQGSVKYQKAPIPCPVPSNLFIYS
jgi:hypothetical protein